MMERATTPILERQASTLRDHLALDRTRLANERTLLGYVRTALALGVVGASALKLFDSVPAWIAGWAFLAGAGGTVLIGARRFWRVRGRLGDLH